MNNNKYYMEKQLANCLVGSPRANRRKIIALSKRSIQISTLFESEYKFLSFYLVFALYYVVATKIDVNF
ncbi:MAG: hypothetical protein IKD76_05170 [Clostridia bacterium]|nr:hypothetical protein [Clostridia bacterium]